MASLDEMRKYLEEHGIEVSDDITLKILEEMYEKCVSSNEVKKKEEASIEEPVAETAEGKPEVSVSHNADPNDNIAWNELDRGDSGYVIQQSGTNEYRLLTEDHEPSWQEMEAFIKQLPPEAKINLDPNLSPEFTAMMIAVLGEEKAKERIDLSTIAPETLMMVGEIRKEQEIESIKVADNPEHRQAEEKESTFVENDLTETAFSDYKNWKKSNEKGTVDEFVKANPDLPSLEYVKAVRENGGTHTRGEALRAAWDKNNSDRKDRKTERFIRALERYSNKNLKNLSSEDLEKQISGFADAHGFLFAKHRRYFEGQMFAGMKKEDRDKYIAMSHDDRTKEVIKYMTTHLAGDGDKKKGYLHTKKKNLWNVIRATIKDYKKIRREERPIRRTERRLRRIDAKIDRRLNKDSLSRAQMKTVLRLNELRGKVELREKIKYSSRNKVAQHALGTNKAVGSDLMNKIRDERKAKGL